METEKSINTDRPFTADEVEDARFIIFAKGKHYSIIIDGDEEEAKVKRVALALLVLSIEGIRVIVPALEDIDMEKVKEKLRKL